MYTLAPSHPALLRALADTFIPALPDDPQAPAGGAGVNLTKLEQAIQAQPLGAQKEFGQLLDLLEKPILGLTWFGPLRPFQRLSPAQREQLLQSWAGSNLPQLRKGLSRAAQALYVSVLRRLAGRRQRPRLGPRRLPGPDLGEIVDTLRPLKTLHPTEDTTYDCDVLVIGSGAGGA